MTGPDYRLDGFEPASGAVVGDFLSATQWDDMYTELAAHHTANDSYLLFYDRAAIWDNVPGSAEYVGMHIHRDCAEGTFTFESARQPTVPFTQNWLSNRGCPPEAIELDEPGPRPADALTSQVEDRLRANSGGRYTLLEDYTHNPGIFREGVEISTLVHDAHPGSAERPYRLFLEETTPSLDTYTVREGAFNSAEAADAWLRDRDTPLPLAPAPASDTVGRRATAALARTTTNATDSTQPPLPGITATPGTVHARSRGLS